MKSSFPQNTASFNQNKTTSIPAGPQVIKTGFTDGLGVNPDFSFLNLIQRSAATISHMKQLKTCMDVWYAKHTA
jgi:hypothetical protein